MKIKNILLLGVLLAATISSCSKDSDTPEPEKGDAQLNIALKASSDLLKATTNEELAGESNINNITVFQFTEDGSGLMIDPYRTEMSASGSATLPDIPSKVGMAKIVLVVNTASGALNGVTSYSQLQSVLAKLSDQSTSNLTMSSQVITTKSPLTEGDNYLGYSSVGESGNINGITTPLEVTRLVARVDLIGLRTEFAGTKLEGGIVRIDEVSLTDIKTASHFFSQDYWGVVMTDGNFANTETVKINKQIYDGSPLSGVTLRNYVMENDGAVSGRPTLVRVKATLLASKGYLEQEKTFTSIVNLNGVVQQGVIHKYVKRNHVYRLNIKFGKNSFDPDQDPMAALDVQVEVVAWGPVTQDVEIE